MVVQTDRLFLSTRTSSGTGTSSYFSLTKEAVVCAKRVGDMIDTANAKVLI